MTDPFAFMQDTAKMDSWWESLDGMWELGIFLAIITVLSGCYALAS